MTTERSQEASKPPTQALEKLLELLNERKHIVEALDSLDELDREYTDEDDDKQVYICKSVTFESSFSLVKAFVTNIALDLELHRELIYTAKRHYRKRMQTIDLLVGLAERAVHQVLTATAEKLEDKLNQ